MQNKQDKKPKIAHPFFITKMRKGSQRTTSVLYTMSPYSVSKSIRNSLNSR